MPTVEQLVRQQDREKEKVARKRKRVDQLLDTLHDTRHDIQLGAKKIARLGKRIEKKNARSADDVSDKGLGFVAHWEGRLEKAYEDVAGHCTIGVGHLLHFGACTAADKQLYWDKDKAYQVLRDDLQLAVNAVNDYIDVQLDQAQFDALVSFAFNCGTGALRDSTLRKRLNAGDYQSVPSELLRWNKAGGVPVQGLTNRRKAEGQLFLNGRYE